LQDQVREHYWQQLTAEHERVRRLHREYMAARDALFAGHGQSQDERLDELWRRYCDSVQSLQGVVFDIQTAAGYGLPLEG
jgi:hypothetical protein